MRQRPVGNPYLPISRRAQGIGQELYVAVECVLEFESQGLRVRYLCPRAVDVVCEDRLEPTAAFLARCLFCIESQRPRVILRDHRHTDEPRSRYAGWQRSWRPCASLIAV